MGLMRQNPIYLNPDITQELSIKANTANQLVYYTVTYDDAPFKQGTIDMGKENVINGEINHEVNLQ
jgi:hypothetical protein